MTLNTDANSMWDELEASRRSVEKKLKAREEMLRRYHGPYYDEDRKPASSEPENPAFEYIATLSAQIVAGTPRCNIKTVRADRPASAMKARALMHAVNRTSRERNDRAKFRKFFVDWCFGPAIALTVRKPMPWLDPGPLDGTVTRPDIRRVPPKLFRYDARATEWEDTRWRGHGTLTSRSALLKLAKSESGWRTKEIATLQTEESLKDYVPLEGQGLSTRDDFMLWCVWVPEEEIDPDFTASTGFYGTMHYYAETGRQKGENAGAPLVEIRDPQPFYGCRTGPYSMSGQMYVPDQVHPLSVMTAVEQVARNLRLQSSVVEQAMRDFGRVLIAGGAAPKNLGLLIKNAKHGGVLNVKGYQRGMMDEFTKGGLDAAMVQMYQFLQEQLDKRMGLSSTQRGVAQSNVTATADTLAAQGTGARVAQQRDEFYAFVQELLFKSAEIIDQDEQFYMPPPPEMAGQVPFIQGGREPGETFDDYELMIEPLSMRFRTEAEMAAAAEAELLLFERVSPMMTQFPFVDWPSVVTDIADATGQSQLPARLNTELAAAIASMMLMGQLDPSMAYQPGAVREEPTMGGDRPATRQMQPPTPMGLMASGAAPARQGAPGAQGAQARQDGRIGAAGSPQRQARSAGASQGNRARKTTGANEGGR